MSTQILKANNVRTGAAVEACNIIHKIFLLPTRMLGHPLRISVIRPAACDVPQEPQTTQVTSLVNRKYAGRKISSDEISHVSEIKWNENYQQ